MPECGVACLDCNDQQILATGEPCHCAAPKEKKEISDEDWINQVHFGPCCSDPGKDQDN